MNLNDFVSVVLTKEGAEILNNRESYYEEIIPNYKSKTWKENDKYDDQLWCLFEIFGCYIDITCKTPFKLNEIVIREKSLISG